MSEKRYARTYSELFNLIEEDIKAKLPDKSQIFIAEFVGYRHVELAQREKRKRRRR